MSNKEILNGNKSANGIIIKNDDGSLTLEKGIVTYEYFHETINNLFKSPHLSTLAGKHEDFVKVNKKVTLKIT